MAYFPNGSSGQILDDQCATCPLGEKACPVFLVQSLYNYDQITDGKPNKVAEVIDILINKDGICQQRKIMGEQSMKVDLKNVMPAMRDWAKTRKLV